MIDPVSSPLVPNLPQARDPALWSAAQKIEGAFLGEMLKAAGLAAPLAEFSGGAGEEQFSSFLRQAQVDRIVESGGVGLAEGIYRALARQEGL